ncbi:hypothetical protein CEUSTIGMA_g6870.t1 [Chlamydomonas eustigma]|uniref:Band 7 domain-containing protein n=1 Tax=Chlamydomonas eustigma TaxID=1157962 RepID=A0A250X940_9CHLO|nr:hypothetical protein CEUSTIGMA_g6870.t1 [Chlamydomonas eustigma]|eukprot:GAX79429.1 hypothetical protein CEUSTIGMA_g6870.t1 [Chlamydomonas eustigma]
MDNRSYFLEEQRCVKKNGSQEISAHCDEELHFDIPPTAAWGTTEVQLREDLTEERQETLEDTANAFQGRGRVVRNNTHFCALTSCPRILQNKKKGKMGVTFRNSASEGSIFIGKRTVKDGECCGVWDVAGKYSIIMGPQRKWMMFSRFIFMDRLIADSHQYLEVRYRNGKKENKRGPLSMFEDPIVHESIAVMNAVTVDAFEVIVVYSEDEHGNVKRNVVHGPTVFIPDVNQWLHVFRWHGSRGKDLHEKVPGALVFTKLRTIPDQFYYNAEGVRTADDTSLTVKVMVFFQLTNLEVMLNSTHDPIGDFINALLADLMNFGCSYSYEQFVQNAQQLSELDTFPVMCGRASAIGFTIGKVVYRGYAASTQLQNLCESAIKTRTELKLKAEEQEQRERMRDYEVRGAHGRGDAERAEELAKQEHQLAMRAAQHQESLKQAEDAHSKALRQKEQMAQVELAAKVAEEQAHLAYLQGLKDMGVDLTQYLVSKSEKQPDKVLKVVTAPSHFSALPINSVSHIGGLNIHTNV